MQHPGSPQTRRQKTVWHLRNSSTPIQQRCPRILFPHNVLCTALDALSKSGPSQNHARLNCSGAALKVRSAPMSRNSAPPYNRDRVIQHLTLRKLPSLAICAAKSCWTWNRTTVRVARVQAFQMQCLLSTHGTAQAFYIGHCFSFLKAALFISHLQRAECDQE